MSERETEKSGRSKMDRVRKSRCEPLIPAQACTCNSIGASDVNLASEWIGADILVGRAWAWGNLEAHTYESHAASDDLKSGRAGV